MEHREEVLEGGTVNAQAAPDQRWVCAACGRHTELGAERYDLKDVSCCMHAVLCHAEKGENGLWRVVEQAEA